MSVREYAVLYVGKGGKPSAGAGAGGGNVVVSQGQHALDGIEHLPTSDQTRLDASTTAHGLLPKLSGDVGEALRGDGTWLTVVTEQDVIALITPDVYSCASLSVIGGRGSIAAGSHTDLHDVGGTTVEIDEATGAVGFNIEAAFTGVDGITQVHVHAYYTGNHADTTLQLYNYDTAGWDTVITFGTTMSVMQLYSASIADGSPYFDGGGNAVARFYHASNGNPAHRLYVDYLTIGHAAATAGGLALDGLTDVDAPAPDDQDVLTWDDGTGTWIAQAPISGESGIPASLVDAKGDLIAATAADTVARLGVGSNGQVLRAASGEPTGLKWEPLSVAITFVIDGAGAAITTGIKGDLEIPFACTLTAWRILADQSGAIVIDVWRDSYTNYPPTDADALPGSGKEPAIPASGTKAEDTAITDWAAYTLAAGDILRFNVDSCTAITRATLTLTATRT